MRRSLRPVMRIDSSLLKFAMVGVTNTVIGLSVIYIAWFVFGFGDLLSNVLGYAVGFLWGYRLNRRWTFRARGAVGQSFWRYALVCAVAYAANLLVLFAVRNAIGEQSFLPHALGTVAYTSLAYLGSRFFAFRNG